MKKIFKTICSGCIATIGLTSSTGCMFAITSCSDNSVIDIIFTNDIHTTLENKDTHIDWAKLKGYRNSLEEKGDKTLLVDAGDSVSGGVYGTLSRGDYIVDLMNECKYDLVVPGNHEFDYGMERFTYLTNKLTSDVISTNFYHTENGLLKERVFNDNKIFHINGKDIGFVGITTPATLTSANPRAFQDDKGNIVYSFLQNDLNDYYSHIQASIDYLNQKCDYVFALTHLGINDKNPQPDEFTSNELIVHTTGLDAVIDGHSHTYHPATQLMDKNNNTVWLTQTGTGFKSVGHVKIQKNEMSFELLNNLDSYVSDPTVQNKIDEIKTETSQILDQKILDNLGFDLTINNVQGTRVVRQRETNMADFFADAISYAIASDEERKSGNLPLTIVNGGGVRSGIEKGEVTIGDVINVASFGNTQCMIEITGEALFNALEYSVYKAKKDDFLPEHEFGGFLQVSDGISFDVDTSQESQVDVVDNVWIGYKAYTFRRVSNVKIKGVDLDPAAKYHIGGSLFTLIDGGDGYKNIFANATIIPIPQVIDYYALSAYLEYCHSKGILDRYNTETLHRINIIN